MRRNIMLYASVIFTSVDTALENNIQEKSVFCFSPMFFRLLAF